MIEIVKTPNADSRSTEKPMTLQELREATDEHISHVDKGMLFFAEMLMKAGEDHDHTKLSRMGEFHAALTGGKIKDSQWYKDHINDERHHLIAHVPNDVTLIDIFEHIVDCLMAGMARSGEVYDIDIPDFVLKKAHENTIELLKKNIQIVDSKKLMDASVK